MLLRAALRHANRSRQAIRYCSTNQADASSGKTGVASMKARAEEKLSQLADRHVLGETIRQLDQSMQYQGYNGLRWVLGIAFSAVLSMYIFRDDVKDGLGSASAEITSRTLGNENVQREAQNLAQGVVYQLLNDKKALELATEFLNHLLAREETRNAVVTLLGSVASQQGTRELLQDLFVRILTQPDFVVQTSLFFQDVFQRESSKVALQNLFAALFADEQFQETTAKFFQFVLYTDTFQSAINSVAADSVHFVLNDEEIGKHAVSWGQMVLMEPTLHLKAGDAIWGAVASAFVPRIFGRGKINPKEDAVNFDEALKKLRKEEEDKLRKKEEEDKLRKKEQEVMSRKKEQEPEKEADIKEENKSKESFVNVSPPTMDDTIDIAEVVILAKEKSDTDKPE